MVETIVAISAIRKLTHSALVSSFSTNGFAQLSKVKFCHLMLYFPFGSLKEKRTMTKIGMKMYSNAAPAATLTKRWPAFCLLLNAVLMRGLLFP